MKLAEVQGQKILFSALNWGMGHVSRSIGLIRELIAQKNQVIVACDESQRPVFESYFPELQFVNHRAYPFNFSGRGSFASDLFDNRKQLLARFVEEQIEVESYISSFQIDLVISDHRYGFFSKTKPSIFVTHQINLPLKWFQFLAQSYHHGLLRNFSQIWCMDDENQSLAGKLSQNTIKKPVEYIGWFSRFEEQEIQQEISLESKKILAVGSGPNPYAQQFLEEIIEFAREYDGKVKCIIPMEEEVKSIPENLEIIVSANWKEMESYFNQCDVLISRAGYSTLMDLKKLHKIAILVPTKGQLEQVYLREFHQESAEWKFVSSLKEIDSI
ncbi:MAG: glycosyltransferase [Crocinitomicaceae bacterium]|nr:glycosyltransferase [Crocinitomicaceae bacterium]